VRTYDPYGTETVSYDGGGDGLPSNPFTFKAGIDDTATGLVKFGQRWYDPYIGAWTQQDTLDTPLDLANGNRYAYAADDPINNYDPTGQAYIPWDFIARTLGSLVECEFQVPIYTIIYGGLVYCVPYGSVYFLIVLRIKG
jgi:RHS repeat-associated protein